MDLQNQRENYRAINELYQNSAHEKPPFGQRLLKMGNKKSINGEGIFF